MGENQRLELTHFEGNQYLYAMLCWGLSTLLERPVELSIIALILTLWQLVTCWNFTCQDGLVDGNTFKLDMSYIDTNITKSKRCIYPQDVSYSEKILCYIGVSTLYYWYLYITFSYAYNYTLYFIYIYMHIIIHGFCMLKCVYFMYLTPTPSRFHGMEKSDPFRTRFQRPFSSPGGKWEAGNWKKTSTLRSHVGMFLKGFLMISTKSQQFGSIDESLFHTDSEISMESAR